MFSVLSVLCCTKFILCTCYAACFSYELLVNSGVGVWDNYMVGQKTASWTPNPLANLLSNGTMTLAFHEEKFCVLTLPSSHPSWVAWFFVLYHPFVSPWASCQWAAELHPSLHLSAGDRSANDQLEAQGWNSTKLKAKCRNRTARMDRNKRQRDAGTDDGTIIRSTWTLVHFQGVAHRLTTAMSSDDEPHPCDFTSISRIQRPLRPASVFSMMMMMMMCLPGRRPPPQLVWPISGNMGLGLVPAIVISVFLWISVQRAYWADESPVLIESHME